MKISKIRNVKTPRRGTEGSAGIDFFVPDDYPNSLRRVEPGERFFIPSGIKANVPTRIAFQVSSKVDSRTILDQGGAEQLLGHGDMLYLPSGSPIPVRVHGAFVDDDEVHRVVESWKALGEPNYLDTILDARSDAELLPGSAGGEEQEDGGEEDALYDEAVAFVTESGRASISAVQRKFRIGYNRAARMVEEMERAGVVSPMNSNGSREVLAHAPPE